LRVPVLDMGCFHSVPGKLNTEAASMRLARNLSYL
jgi:hypothetical protein